MAIIRDWINPIMRNVPAGWRPNGYLGGMLVALIAAINPKSYFTRPYFGAISWLILAWWFYSQSPAGLIRPKDPSRRTLFKGNPRWYQVIKSLLWGLLTNPIPMFMIYYVMLVLARMDARLL